MNGGPITLRVQQSLKLTEDSATIDKLKGERAYTPANDPYRKFSKEQPGWAGDAAYGKAAGNAMVVAKCRDRRRRRRNSECGGGGLGVEYSRDAMPRPRRPPTPPLRADRTSTCRSLCSKNAARAGAGALRRDGP